MAAEGRDVHPWSAGMWGSCDTAVGPKCCPEGVGALLLLSEDGQQLSGCPEESREAAELRDGFLWDRGTQLSQLLLRESS